MWLMHDVFVVVAISGCAYFLFCLRQFDFLSVAFFSACVYFLPGFFGYTVAPVSAGLAVPVDLENQTYVVMLGVLMAIWAGAILFDLAGKGDVRGWSLERSRAAALCTTLLAVIGFVLIWATAGEALFDDDKIVMMESLNRWHVLGATSAPLGAVLAFASRRWLLLTVCMALLMFDMYIGFRVSFGIALIATFTLHLSRYGRQRLAVQNWRIGCLGIVFVLILFVYKQVYVAVKLGLWDVILDRLTDTDLYASAILMSEPFNTQAILNEVIAQDFHVGMEHFQDVLFQFLLFSPELGGTSRSFNDFFQATLFSSELEYSMANNIWAEMISSGGWVLLGLFLGIFVLLLMLGSHWVRSSDANLAAGIAVVFSYWAFYIHRNDLLYQINLEKRTILVWIACLVSSRLLAVRPLRTLKTSREGYCGVEH